MKNVNAARTEQSPIRVGLAGACRVHIRIDDSPGAPPAEVSGRGAVAAARYFIFAFAFLRSAQYFFIRCETALRATVDMVRPRFRAL
jgi:hypothetical protein